MAISDKDLEEIENETVSTPSVDVDDLDNLLSDYKQKYKESDPVQDTDKGSVETESTTDTSPATATTNPDAWKGNPSYYQTGKKAGKLRKIGTGGGSVASNSTNEQMSISGSLIDGGLFLMLVDMLFPLLIVVANNKFTDNKVKIEDLQLTDKQKKDLTPIAEEVIKQMSITADPKWLLIGSLAGIYGINYMAVVSGASEKKK